MTHFALESKTMQTWGASWLDFVGLALAISLLEAASRGVGVTHGRGGRSYWRVAPRFRPILGLAAVGLLVLVAADVLTRSHLLPR
jgi:hypothetical protein